MTGQPTPHNVPPAEIKVFIASLKGNQWLISQNCHTWGLRYLFQNHNWKMLKSSSHFFARPHCFGGETEVNLAYSSCQKHILQQSCKWNMWTFWRKAARLPNGPCSPLNHGKTSYQLLKCVIFQLLGWWLFPFPRTEKSPNHRIVTPIKNAAGAVSFL